MYTGDGVYNAAIFLDTDVEDFIAMGTIGNLQSEEDRQSMIGIVQLGEWVGPVSVIP